MTTATSTNGRVIPPQQQPQDDHHNEFENPDRTSTDEFEKVEKLRRERDEAAALAEVQSSPAFDDVLSNKEVKARRKAAEKLRKKKLAHDTKRDLRHLDEDANETDALDRIAKQDRRRRVDLARAQRLRDQLTDGGKNLASVYRHQRFVRLALGATTLVGIAWTSYNVGTGLGGDNLLYYGIEPLFSVPLVTIVVMQMVAALNGRLRKVAPTKMRPDGKKRLSAVGWVEVGLLLGTTIIGVWPSVMELFTEGQKFSGQMFVVRLIAPTLIVVSVVLQLVAAELFGDIIRDAHLTGDADDDNLRTRVRQANELVLKIRADIASGDLEVGETGQPSISAIQKRYAVAKVTAQAAHDALPIFTTPIEVKTS